MTIHRTWHTLININNMKFQLIVPGLLIFYIRFCELQKASGITPWKKCYSLLRWPCLLQDVLNRRLLFKTKWHGNASIETITHHFFVSGIGQKKTVDAAKICGGAENVIRETQQTFVNGLLGFITLGIYTPLEAHCVLLTIIMSCPSIWATLYLTH